MAHILRSPSDVAQLLHNSNNDLSKVISLLLRPRSVKTSEVAISKVRNQSRNLHENYNTAAIKTSYSLINHFFYYFYCFLHLLHHVIHLLLHCIIYFSMSLILSFLLNTNFTAKLRHSSLLFNQSHRHPFLG